MTNSLEGRVALITGAGRGMGRSHALLMAERGANIIVSDIDGNNANSVAEEVRALGRSATAVIRDVTDVAAFAAEIAAAEADHGHIDILVNNAGIPGNRAAIEEIDEGVYDAMVGVKMKASFFATRAVISGMKQRNYGKIINISSNFAMEGHDRMSHYVGSATGMLGFTRAWAREFAPWNIMVNAVAPALVETELTLPSMGIDLIRQMEKAAPLGRLTGIQDVSYCVAWLASAETDMITGQALAPNAGMTIVGI